MADKPKQTSVDPAYWCTCIDNPESCMGCAVDKLVARVLGEMGTKWLNARTYHIPKTEKKK